MCLIDYGYTDSAKNTRPYLLYGEITSRFSYNLS